jgi:hypothetical protein
MNYRRNLLINIGIEVVKNQLFGFVKFRITWPVIRKYAASNRRLGIAAA